MGGSSSKFVISNNDYQLAIEVSKEFEDVLEREFHAQGKGLHEKVTSVEAELPVGTVRSIRYISSVRNSLIHDRNVKSLANRDLFIQKYKTAMEELEIIVEKKKRQNETLDVSSNKECIIQ